MADSVRDIRMAISKEQNDCIPSSVSLPDFREVLHPEIGQAGDLTRPGAGGFRKFHLFRGATPRSRLRRRNPSLTRVLGLIGSVQREMQFFGLHESDDEDEDEDPITNVSDASGYVYLDCDPIPEDHFAGAELAKTKKPEEVQAGAGVGRTVLVLWKGFVGPATLYLGSAFKNGGMAFSAVVLVLMSIVSLWAMLLLVQCRQKVKSTFGGIGEAAIGKIGRYLVDFSLILSQTGFCCSYLIFVQKNFGLVLHSLGITYFVDKPWLLILCQFPIVFPLVWVRRLKYFGITNLIADVLILFGIIYIYTHNIIEISNEGLHNLTTFEPKTFALFIGTAVVAFEGIGLVIPIQESMLENEHRFPTILISTFVVIGVLYATFGSVNYAVFGDDILSPVTMNLKEDALGQSVQVAFSLACILTFPVQMFPVVGILEHVVFGVGKKTLIRKWRKNFFRMFLVLCCCGISIFGSNNFENFISLVGAFCCVPLAFIYPALFHYKLVATSWFPKLIDVCFIVAGIVVMIFSTAISVITWGDKQEG